MSRLTQSKPEFRVGFLLVLGFLAITPQIGRSDGDISDLNRSMNDFYKAMRDSPDKSPVRIQQLKQQILDPPVQKKVEEDRKSLSSGTGGKAGGSGGRYSDDSGGSGSAPISEPIMDSKDVPAELEFPGAAVAAPKPVASSKPAVQRH